MEQIGRCAKCGKVTTVRDHHIKGYSEEYKDYVAPYCRSCDVKAHNKARTEGRCKLTYKDAQRLSKSSYRRRINRYKYFRQTIATNIRLIEVVGVNTNTGSITVSSYFAEHNGIPLKTIKEQL